MIIHCIAGRAVGVSMIYVVVLFAYANDTWNSNLSTVESYNSTGELPPYVTCKPMLS